ncbi:Vps5 C terminal like-domain-containing protein [Jimgerdemannia flammicorona]|uniref:Vps5 C terminal like-domain-containing protein n=1 Tax=Jimgerdemannia flammicorona TaxID=994334 RepID=A0A433QDC2_9FUNG|nr:Vps5 C terminal like-domain-containing protein [Jimgerdemannia flammicorona]
MGKDSDTPIDFTLQRAFLLVYENFDADVVALLDLFFCRGLADDEILLLVGLVYNCTIVLGGDGFIIHCACFRLTWLTWPKDDGIAAARHSFWTRVPFTFYNLLPPPPTDAMNPSLHTDQDSPNMDSLTANPFADAFSPHRMTQSMTLPDPVQPGSPTLDSPLSKSFADLRLRSGARVPGFGQPPPTHVEEPENIDEGPENIDEGEDDSAKDALSDEDNEPLGRRADQQSLRVPETGVRPTFEISVGEPLKIGDITSAHIVYKVRTKVRYTDRLLYLVHLGQFVMVAYVNYSSAHVHQTHHQTNSPAYKSPEFTVTRRYRDFLWLYNQLTNGNPGVVVPPVPEKHALGRFQDEFVESRRVALEKCLRKIVAHPMLYGDPDLKLFLESESFNIDVKQKRSESDSSKGGFIKSIGETITNATTAPFVKPAEVDEWFDQRRGQLDALESQLRALMRSVEAVVKQRKDLGAASTEFGESMLSLASAELNKPLANHLTVLGNLQKRIKELHDKQAQQDILTLENTVDEYIRIIGSIKIAFGARTKSYQVWQNADYDLQRKRANLEKARVQGKTRQDRLAQMQQEITEAEHKVISTKRDFEEISRLVRAELDRFDKEKVEDFKSSVEDFLESMVENQKEIIALWESYFTTTEEDLAQPQPRESFSGGHASLTDNGSIAS